MVEFSQLHPIAQEQVRRITAGRPPDAVDQAYINQAIAFIESNPSLAKQWRGGAPTGLTPERAEVYRETIIEQQALAPSEKERLQALGKIAEVSITKSESRVEVRDTGGGYFIDPKTGQGFSSQQDLTTQGYIRTATPQDIQRGEVARQDGVVFGRQGVQEYNVEVKRIQEQAPKEKFLEPRTGQLFEEKQITKIGEFEAIRTPIKVYTDPLTGEPIKEIRSYLEEKRIPISEKRPEITSTQEFVKKLEEPRTYDILGLETYEGIPKKGITIGEEWIPSPQAYGTVTTAEEAVTILASLPKAGSFALGKGIGGILRTPAIGVFGGLDVAGYATGINKIVAEKLEQAGEVFKVASVSGGKFDIPTYGAGVALGTLAKIPSQSEAELALDIAVGGALVGKSKKIIPRLYRGTVKTGIAGYSAYEIATGTPEEKLLGALGLFVVSPDIIKVGRGVKYRLSPDFVKTKTDVTGIKYADIDLGKIDVDVEKGILTKETDILRLEFIPSRKETFAESIDPLKTISQEIALREKPKLPKTTPEQKLILDIVKEEGGIVSGSFAQQTLIRQSRKFKDLDILIRDPRKIATKIEGRYGDIFRVEKKEITESPLGRFDIYKVYEKKTGKQLADIDPIKFAEEGFARLYRPVEVDGLKLLLPEVRLTSKILQQARPLPSKKRAKVITDIAQILGEKGLETSPSLLRGYGLTKEQQKLAFLKGEFFATHGGRGLLTKKGEITLGGLDVGSPKLFFYTPSLVRKGVAYARRSRMGIGVDAKSATLRDIIKGDKLTFFGKKADVIIERGKLGKDFIQPNIRTTEIEVARLLKKKGKKLKITKRFKTIVEGEPVDIAFAEDISGRALTKKLSKEEARRMNRLISEQLTRRKEIIKLDIPTKIPIKRMGEEEIFRESTKRLDIKTPRITTPIFRSRDITRRIEAPRREAPARITTRIPERVIAPRLTERITPTIVTPRTIIRTPRREAPARITTRIPVRIPDVPVKIAKIKPKRDEREKRRLKKIPTYQLAVRRKGIFEVERKGLTRKEAIILGSDITLKQLARTFKIRKTGEKEIFGIEEQQMIPEERLFRQYKVRKGRAIDLPNIFIQRRRALLQTREEKRAIQQARRQAMEVNRIINI